MSQKYCPAVENFQTLKILELIVGFWRETPFQLCHYLNIIELSKQELFIIYYPKKRIPNYTVTEEF